MTTTGRFLRWVDERVRGSSSKGVLQWGPGSVQQEKQRLPSRRSDSGALNASTDTVISKNAIVFLVITSDLGFLSLWSFRASQVISFLKCLSSACGEVSADNRGPAPLPRAGWGPSTHGP